jgi:hypothetical protein
MQTIGRNQPLLKRGANSRALRPCKAPDKARLRIATAVRILLCAIALASPLAAQTPNNASLPGHVIKALANATRLPHTPQMDEEPITVTVALNLSDPEGAKSLVEEYSNPTSPNYQRTITVSEFTARFGPSQEAWDTVLAYLQQNGLTLSRSAIHRRMMSVTGTRAQVQKAFNVIIDDYQLGDRTFHAVAGDPVVPAAIAPLIATVAGLSNLARPHTLNTPFPLQPASLATAYNGALTPAGTTNTGGVLPPGLDGAGTTIGLLEFDGFQFSDVSAWLSLASLPANLVNRVGVHSINGGGAPSGCTQKDNNCGTTEALLDIAAVLGIAPGAVIAVFAASPGTDLPSALDEAAFELTFSAPAVLSISLVYCEDTISSSEANLIDNIAAINSTSGVSIFAGSGDSGATCADGSANTTAAPADAPYVVAVGGTMLNVDSDNTYDTESWWTTNNSGSGGFGTSQFFSEPTYQSTLYPGAAGRSVPDVSMYAFPGVTISQSGTAFVAGGTSLATPLWAATWALLDQANLNAGRAPLNAANGNLYTLTKGLHRASTMTGLGNNFQHVGLGSPDITNLIAIAVPPQIDSFSPPTGFFAGGTKVTIHGAGFIGVKKVTFGGYAGTNLTIESDTKLTVDTPFAHDNAGAAVKVVTPGGTATAPGLFDYDPIINSVSPTTGPIGGETTVTITGIALSNVMNFEFGDGSHLATKVSCPTHESCTMASPAHAPGLVKILVVTPWGYVSSPAPEEFKYEAPAITTISPLVGPTTGGLFIALNGAGLANGKTTVSFGGTDATGVFCVGTTYCGMTSPAHAAGVVQVTVTVEGNTSPPAYTEFTFYPFPTVTRILPNVGNPGTVVTLTGTNFSTTPGQTTFSFFGISVPGACGSSTTQCTAVVPSESGGTAQYTAVTATVYGDTSLDSVEFHYPQPPPPPPCIGVTCM